MMDFLTPEEIAELKKEPVKKKPRTTRVKAENVRDYETWFKKMKQFGGHCTNPQCSDPRPPSQYPTQMVATLSNEQNVCRYCFLEGYGLVE
jgi:hypothetical protein